MHCNKQDKLVRRGTFRSFRMIPPIELCIHLWFPQTHVIEIHAQNRLSCQIMFLKLPHLFWQQSSVWCVDASSITEHTVWCNTKMIPIMHWLWPNIQTQDFFWLLLFKILPVPCHSCLHLLFVSPKTNQAASWCGKCDYKYISSTFFKCPLLLAFSLPGHLSHMTTGHLGSMGAETRSTAWLRMWVIEDDV